MSISEEDLGTIIKGYSTQHAESQIDIIEDVIYELNLEDVFFEGESLTGCIKRTGYEKEFINMIQKRVNTIKH